MTTKELLAQMPEGAYAPMALPGAFYAEPIEKWPADERERYLAVKGRMEARRKELMAQKTPEQLRRTNELQKQIAEILAAAEA